MLHEYRLQREDLEEGCDVFVSRVHVLSNRAQDVMNKEYEK